MFFCFGLVLGPYHAISENLGGIFQLLLSVTWHDQHLILIVICRITAFGLGQGSFF